MTQNTMERPPVHDPEAQVVTKKKFRIVPWLVLLAIAGGATYLFPKITQMTPQAGGPKKGKMDAGRPVPVVAAVAKRGDMPVFLDGLGAVQAFYTVTVKTRVDGQIMKVYFQEGQFVKEGDPLIDIDPRPYQVMLDQAQGQLAHDQALLQNSKVDLERYKILLKQQAIPEQTYATQEALVTQYNGTIEQDQAAIENAKLQLVYAHITSPITGRIGLRIVDPGNVVHAADTTGLVVITQLQPIAVIFNIAEDSLPQVTKKIAAGEKLPVYAYDRGLKTRLATGTLATIDNQIDQTTGTVRFKAIFQNEDLSLFPNQFVNARLLIDTQHGMTIIPTAAIQRSPDSTFVYVVKSDNTVEVRNIKQGVTEGDQAAIDEGLQPGDKVVIDGIDKLQQGSKVTVRMAGPGGAAPQRTT
ncbi:MAG TPA: MdtA/MuxA family multidrug efflux RND transporter periplasmic adaptor subunit [Bryobacteraceae bacterium]|nr:MdtA/MuxA family multidrug efflux RND transporter periplasmic adaptor subunit [Bryobacteraceae bacterium]